MDKKKAVKITKGSNDVFADLGIQHTQEDKLKIAIARAINNTIAKRKLTQVQAAKIAGTDQAKMSSILRGRIDEFSIERMMKFLTLLGNDLDIRISRKTSHATGTIRIKGYA